MKAVAAEPVGALALEPVAERAGVARLMTRNRSVLFGGTILALVVLVAILAPVLGTTDPARVEPVLRNKRPGAVASTRNADGSQTARTHWMGTDSLGRDVYSRVIYGARVSLIVGASVALISTLVGLVIGVLAGYVRWLDGIVMRIMD
ncbi:MAG: ABC transporter permease, partial [Candidatus Rokuibacteriota bacterium]